jgi:PilZ domain
MGTDEGLGHVRSFGYRAPRVTARFPVAITIPPSAVAVNGVCRNIGEEGMAAELNHPLEPGIEVMVNFGVLDFQPLRISARVEYQRDGCFGFIFVFESGTQRQQLRSWIRTLAEDGS